MKKLLGLLIASALISAVNRVAWPAKTSASFVIRGSIMRLSVPAWATKKWGLALGQPHFCLLLMTSSYFLAGTAALASILASGVLASILASAAGAAASGRDVGAGT